MRRHWQKHPTDCGAVAGFFAMPLLWAMQVMLLRLAQGKALPQVEIFLGIAVLGAFFGVILGASIASALDYYRDGEWKKARRLLIIGPAIVIGGLMLLLWTLLPDLIAPRHPMMDKFLPVPLPPQLLLFLDPRNWWNFPLHVMFLMLFIGLLLRVRR